jgi:hypothetical protein
MPQEIYDATQAIINDIIEPLFTYKLGSLSLDIYPSSAIEGKHSFKYIQSQLFANAIANEYDELSKRASSVIENSREKGMTRESATEYADLLRQLNEKEIELNTYTVQYIEALALLEDDKLVPLLEKEIKSLNDETGKNISLTKVVNNIYRKINEYLKSITVETTEEEEAKLYNRNSDEEITDTDLGNDVKTLESNITSTVNGSLNAVTSSVENSELVAPSV